MTRKAYTSSFEAFYTATAHRVTHAVCVQEAYTRA
jgi:hypothetical protein